MLTGYSQFHHSSPIIVPTDTATTIDSIRSFPSSTIGGTAANRNFFANPNSKAGNYSPPLMPFPVGGVHDLDQANRSFSDLPQVPNNSLAASPFSSAAPSPQLIYQNISALCSGIENIGLAPLPPPLIVSAPIGGYSLGEHLNNSKSSSAARNDNRSLSAALPQPSRSINNINHSNNSLTKEQNIWRSPDTFSLYTSGGSSFDSGSPWLSPSSVNIQRQKQQPQHIPSHINNSNIIISTTNQQMPAPTFSPRSFRSNCSSAGSETRTLHSPDSLPSSWKQKELSKVGIPSLRLPASSIPGASQQQQQQQPQHPKSGVGSKQLARMSRKLELDQEALRKYANRSINDLKGQLYALSKDQYGCRYLQKLLEDQPRETTAAICDEVAQHFSELITDPFGNYMTQKFLMVCNSQQKTTLVKSIMPQLPRIAKDMHGTRALQKLVENLDSDIQAHLIAKGLERETFDLIRDLNANHVIQKCLKNFTPEFNQFIYNVAMSRCRELSSHRHGCCVIQRCIDQGNLVQRENLIRGIARCIRDIIEDPFGNYVVQYVLDLRDPAYVNSIAACLSGRICAYSTQKYSSNVVEKCLRVSNRVVRQQLIQEFFQPGALDDVLRDSYGNYVIQTAFESAEPNQRHLLIEACLPSLGKLGGSAPGRRLINKLLQLEPAYMNSGAAVSVIAKARCQTHNLLEDERYQTLTAAFEGLK